MKKAATRPDHLWVVVGFLAGRTVEMQTVAKSEAQAIGHVRHRCEVSLGRKLFWVGTPRVRDLGEIPRETPVERSWVA